MKAIDQLADRMEQTSSVFRKILNDSQVFPPALTLSVHEKLGRISDGLIHLWDEPVYELSKEEIIQIDAKLCLIEDELESVIDTFGINPFLSPGWN